MDKKVVICWETKKNDRTYSLHLPVGAPYGDAYGVMFEWLQEITEEIKKATEASRPLESAPAEDAHEIAN